VPERVLLSPLYDYQAFPFGQPTSGQLYGIFQTGIYLFLHRPVPGPTTCHRLLLFKSIPSVIFIKNIPFKKDKTAP